MESKSRGVIYILTNPSFPDYVKIGYADDVNKRLRELNRSECIPFAFRLYAYYEVPQRLTDKKLHELIDMINPDLRAIAQINGLEDNLHKVKPSEKDLEEEETAEENRILATNRHHFKNIEFTSSLTGHTYRSSTNEKGTLSIFDVMVGEEVPNNANPSKREIVRAALSDLTRSEEEGTLYQLIHRLEKMIVINKQTK